MTVALAGARRRVRRARTLRRHVTTYVITIVVLGAAWFAATSTSAVSAQTLASPQDVFSAFRELNSQGEIWSNLGVTFFRIILSFVIGCAVGAALGSLLWRIPFIGDAISPYLSVGYSIPLVVFYPMFLVVLGINDWPIVILTAVMTVIPVALNTAHGLDRASGVLVNVGKTLEWTPMQIFRQIRIPAAWPDIVAGMKLSMVYGVVGVVAMEFVAGNSGIGSRIQYYYEAFGVASMYAYILLALVLAAVCVWIVLGLEAATTRGRR